MCFTQYISLGLIRQRAVASEEASTTSAPPQHRRRAVLSSSQSYVIVMCTGPPFKTLLAHPWNTSKRGICHRPSSFCCRCSICALAQCWTKGRRRACGWRLRRVTRPSRPWWSRCAAPSPRMRNAVGGTTRFEWAAHSEWAGHVDNSNVNVRLGQGGHHQHARHLCNCSNRSGSTTQLGALTAWLYRPVG
jgi:hypothetical protein